MASDADPKPAIKPWSSGIAPNFIGVFLWIAYYDQFGRVTLGKSADGLRWPAVGAVVGALIAFVGFYYAPAMWGLRTRRGFAELAESPFGTSGSRWLVSPAIGLAQVGWFAIATYYATDFTLRGLVSLKLLDSSYLATVARGGFEQASPLFLGTALLWSLAFAFVGQFAVRLVAAIMNVFPIFPALVIAGATAKTLADLPGGSPPVGESAGALLAFGLAAQLVLGFFAGSAPMAAEWGASSRDGRDIRLGGFIGVACAATILAILGLLITAGSDRPPIEEPRLDRPMTKKSRTLVPFSPPPRVAATPLRPATERVPTVGDVLQNRIGGSLGGSMLFVLAMGSMAPAVFAASSFGGHFSRAFPSLSRTAWALIGTALAFPLIVIGLPMRAEWTSTILGALIAPILGAFSADFVRRPGFWPGSRPGWNRSGVIAWVVGVFVGLLPLIGRATRSDHLSRIQPAAGFAFAAAFAIYFVASFFPKKNSTAAQQ